MDAARRHAIRGVALTFFALSACVSGPELVPVPGEQALITADSAFVEAAGVRLWVRTERWDGVPAELGDRVTPVQVSMENRSGHPVRLAYQDFSLLGGSGFRYAALPPFTIRGSFSGLDTPDEGLAPEGRVVRVMYRPPPPPHHGHVRPRFHSHRFHVAPPYVRFYMGFTPWPHPWHWDIVYYEQWHRYWPSQLPSEEMLQKALPEGVLEDGGSVAGYLYFQHIGRESSVKLEVQLNDATTNERLGQISVPFFVRR